MNIQFYDVKNKKKVNVSKDKIQKIKYMRKRRKNVYDICIKGRIRWNKGSVKLMTSITSYKIHQ
jgi:hypothetical protein